MAVVKEGDHETAKETLWEVTHRLELGFSIAPILALAAPPAHWSPGGKSTQISYYDPNKPMEKDPQLQLSTLQ